MPGRGRGSGQRRLPTMPDTRLSSQELANLIGRLHEALALLAADCGEVILVSIIQQQHAQGCSGSSR
jgi:hypothetical protein